MKLSPHPSISRRLAIALMEMVVYLAVFFILAGVGLAAFYAFWDRSAALAGASAAISSALHAGERWRADVRSATGRISIQTNSTGVVLSIPQGKTPVYYGFHDGVVRRGTGSLNSAETVLENVQASAMEPEARGPIMAWRWELQLASPPKHKLVPLEFTFEAATTPAP